MVSRSPTQGWCSRVFIIFFYEEYDLFQRLESCILIYIGGTEVITWPVDNLMVNWNASPAGINIESWFSIKRAVFIILFALL